MKIFETTELEHVDDIQIFLECQEKVIFSDEGPSHKVYFPSRLKSLLQVWNPVKKFPFILKDWPFIRSWKGAAG